jgi:hypothetical protein
LDQNAAMRAFGATVVEFGRDFDEALTECYRVARERDLHFISPFNRDQVKGVASYALELFGAVADLDTSMSRSAWAPASWPHHGPRSSRPQNRDCWGVARNAPAMALSFAAGKPVQTNSAQTFADGIATRDPRQEALTIIKRGAARILQLTEDDIAEAVRAYFQDTHNVAEGAGAAPLAGLMQERIRMAGKRVAVILSGGNIDTSVYRRNLAGETPKVGRHAPGIRMLQTLSIATARWSNSGLFCYRVTWSECGLFGRSCLAAGSMRLEVLRTSHRPAHSHVIDPDRTRGCSVRVALQTRCEILYGRKALRCKKRGRRCQRRQASETMTNGMGSAFIGARSRWRYLRQAWHPDLKTEETPRWLRQPPTHMPLIWTSSSTR